MTLALAAALALPAEAACKAWGSKLLLLLLLLFVLLLLPCPAEVFPALSNFQQGIAASVRSGQSRAFNARGMRGSPLQSSLGASAKRAPAPR